MRRGEAGEGREGTTALNIRRFSNRNNYKEITGDTLLQMIESAA